MQVAVRHDHGDEVMIVHAAQMVRAGGIGHIGVDVRLDERVQLRLLLVCAVIEVMLLGELRLVERVPRSVPDGHDGVADVAVDMVLYHVRQVKVLIKLLEQLVLDAVVGNVFLTQNGAVEFHRILGRHGQIKLLQIA